MRRLVEPARIGHLATFHSRPHVVPVCFALVGDVAYTAVDHKPKRTTELRRIANVRATGVACLLVDHYGEDWATLWWVRLDGRARVVDVEHEARRGLDALVAKYEQYADNVPAGPVLALDIDQWSGWSAASGGRDGAC